ncbi:SDR family oxidoreductase [Phenylobacterium deserti]|uniref:Short chain dehydrogenase n=1 Tax=Phenylobacterium deserti TaxID=1914756 RepID=A0A328ADD3_9CAUL|nr:SDR family oxidoreductase [Phenylobacterium deserti]RAK52679.1 short chain dehydrogenase [Phenylobacterium deserti]
MTRWTTEYIPSQRGRRAVVTGTGGLGYEDALQLARAGAEVIIAGRNPAKGAEAVHGIRESAPRANVRFERVDLADLASVAAFGERLKGQLDGLDLLINNAGVMTPPKRQTTADGFELQLGANHLGHFALTAALLPLLRNGVSPRMISVSSVAARQGEIDFDDLNAERSYRPMPVYAQSKLACLMFALEFDRRSRSASWGVAGIAAHPGVARTQLLFNTPGGHPMRRVRSALWFLFQPVPQGALPTLFAATDRSAQGGGYYGPDGPAEVRGFPAPAKIPPRALDETACARLWEMSEQLTGVQLR